MSGLLLFTANNLFAQQNILGKDTITDPQLIQSDTITKKVVLSSALTSEVNYGAFDSIVVDHQHNIIYLYGKARILYEEFELDADYIRLDQNNNTVFARGYIDSLTNRYSRRPIFKQGSEPPITTDSLVYNFETKKVKVYSVSTQVEGGYILAEEVKKNEYDEAFINKGIYTSCNLPHPHFGIHSRKLLVTENQVLTGPAYLEIEGIPLPIVVPFGLFPKTNKRASGILFPTFGEDFTRGFFMRDLGYYVGLNDYWGAEFRTTLYSKGSYDLSTLASYRKNYKFDGRVNLRYSSTRTGVEGTPGYNPTKDFNIQWSHSQRPEANPGTTFSASVNAGTSTYLTRTAGGGSYDRDEVTRNSLSSSISYGKTFANGLVNFTSSLSHNQDLATKRVFLQLPTFNLNVSTISPFDSKDRVGEQKWYQRLTVGYSLQGSNSIETTENLLFKRESLEKFKNGFQHNIPVSLSLNLLKYMQFSSSVQYSEKWYLQTIRKNFDPLVNAVQTDTTGGFARAYDYTFSTGFATKLYGRKNFRKGKLEALRHIMTPSFSFSYRPDFGKESFGFCRDVQTNSLGNTQRYSIFEQGIFGGPGIGRVAAMGFSVENTIDGKIRANGDSTNATSRNIPLLQGLSFSGNYNFVADSFKLSTINFGGRTSLFKQSISINFYGTFDPYKLNNLGQRVNEFAVNDGKVARLTSAGFAFDFNLNSKAGKSRNDALRQVGDNTGRTPAQIAELERISRDPNSFVDFSIPWNINAAYSFNYSKTGLEANITNTLNLTGDLSVTPKWKVRYTSGYDFQTKGISYTTFSILRDLHCWDMSFNWVPFGQYRSYSFDLKVRSSILQDLKLSRRRDYFNNF